ncbi:hypothetical protein RI367_001390 [Sorochytrium milnesiophthora]
MTQTQASEQQQATTAAASSAKMALIDEETGDLTPEFEALLSKVFDHFDTKSTGKWQVEQMQAFAKATNGKEFDKETLNELQEFFCDDKKCMTKEHFYDMYHLQSQNDEDETHSDISKWTFLSTSAGDVAKQ